MAELHLPTNAHTGFVLEDVHVTDFANVVLGRSLVLAVGANDLQFQGVRDDIMCLTLVMCAAGLAVGLGRPVCIQAPYVILTFSYNKVDHRTTMKTALISPMQC
jgi:hypothetical protein